MQVTAAITLTSANTNYDLYTLAVAVNAAFPKNCQELTVLADPANVAEVLCGDGTLSATQYGYNIAPGGSFTHRAPTNGISVSGRKIRSTSAGMILHLSAEVL